MRLWTVQDEEVYNIIMEKGEYLCDGSKSENLESELFKIAYTWLVEKMEEKLGKAPEGIQYPVWAWPFKPDFRKRCWKTSGEKCVRIEFEIDESEIFITDFFGWHMPLNHFPLFDIDDDDEWEEVYSEFERLKFDERDKVLKKSWEKIIYDKIPDQKECAQITFWRLKKEQIKKVDHLIAR